MKLSALFASLVVGCGLAALPRGSIADRTKPSPLAPDPAFDIDPAEAAKNQHYRQPERPQFHYTPIQGHVADATGLIFYAGEYHLFYMSDKWERRRNRHKCWGHAVSRDLLHWQELPSVLDPLLDHMPGSGSGIVDFNNTLQLQAGGEKTLAIIYTDYQIGSCLASSNDCGRTWTRFPGNPILRGARDMRDPLVFWYEPARQWRMVRYEKKGFVFYGSADLRQWRELSRVEGYYECPDFVELPIAGAPGQRKWVLIGGDSRYRIGSFDGTTFQPETPMLSCELSGSHSFYASQTWKQTVAGEVAATQIGFLRHPPGSHLTWHDQFSFPVSLALRQTPDGPRLYREPLREISNLRADSTQLKKLTVQPGENALSALHGDCVEIRGEIEFGSATALLLDVRGKTIRYAADGSLDVFGMKHHVPPAGGRVSLQLLVDRSSVELFIDHGRASVSRCVFFDAQNKSFGLASEGGTLRVASFETSALKSVWPKK